MIRLGLLPVPLQVIWRSWIPPVGLSGSLRVQRPPVDPIDLLCGLHHHLERRGALGSDKVQIMLCCLLSCLGTGWVLPWSDSNITKFWMARQLRSVDQPSYYVHYHGCCRAFSAVVLGRWRISWLQREPSFSHPRRKWQLSRCHAFCRPPKHS